MDSPTPTQLEEELDSDIASIRRELRALKRRKTLLASSLLSSSTLQTHLRRQSSSRTLALTSLDADVSPLVQSANAHTHTNHHRIAFSATAFPFQDPNPSITTSKSSRNLLGIRLDICARNGRFPKPHYILLRHVPSKGEGKRLLRIHRHTIPPFIPLDQLERVYLASSFTARLDHDAPVKHAPPARQDLRGLVREVRAQLVAWQLRLDAIAMLREQIGTVRRDAPEYGDGDSDAQGMWERDVWCEDDGAMTRLVGNKLGIVALSPTARDATYVRMAWADGRVGRFKISSRGMIDRAVVIGDQGRDKAMECVLTGRVEGLLARASDMLGSTTTPPGKMTDRKTPSG
ncbi:hypothetical protein P168DRAFT_314014 [Aspergillus campestris IBT 28561]|uniref:Cenp-O kinetochore centromere component n=1 Tax=Aspergillus campestris (strain IBT 28561) TaxID=1392248 RepID=A0A2I1DDD1_ASPC2|nr:uncharacterized protein P168DRAFT_314014 [Aspergillus campestris IBT 28561]PKY07876.1 hypothetical protein P168DRAFT_314014 [Aspergillus campestris IBT 28561]